MGGSLLTTGSLLAAFFAGGVALFAPCCIVFLAPSYLAVAVKKVKNRRWRLLPLTFVFAAGLALVLVPITLGTSLLAAAISNYHAPLYYTGGVLMLALAAYSLSGRMWSLPSFLRAPDTARGDSASFFALGVFSGIASSCCAPVLAGVMTLSALSGSALGGVALGLAYVLGMTFPLLVVALAWDRYRLGERRWMRARSVRLHVAGRTLLTNTINVAVAVAFAVMGGFVIYLANTGRMTGGPGFQVAIGRFLTRVFARIEAWTAPVPEPVLGLAVLGIVAVFVVATLRDRAPLPAMPSPPTRAPATTPGPVTTTPRPGEGSDHDQQQDRQPAQRGAPARGPRRRPPGAGPPRLAAQPRHLHGCGGGRRCPPRRDAAHLPAHLVRCGPPRPRLHPGRHHRQAGAPGRLPRPQRRAVLLRGRRPRIVHPADGRDREGEGRLRPRRRHGAADRDEHP